MPVKVKERGAQYFIHKAKVPGRHAAGGVAGLFLQVRGNATSWVLRTTVGTRRRDIGLGGYPDVTLAEARERARAARARIEQGVDPIEERRSRRQALSAVLTFDEAARRMIAAREAEWRSPKHRAQWVSTLETYASPVIGPLPVEQVELRHVLDVLEPIWLQKTETASRVRGRIERILDWASVRGYRSGENPARWKGNLDHLLAKPNKVRKVRHHTALPAREMYAFAQALRGRSGTAARALEFLILTATRSGEVRGARWSEIDLASATWTIPAGRMKADKEHRVPLSARAVEILRQLPRFAGNHLVFPSPKGLVMSDMTLLKVLQRMGVDAVPHGFRSTFRDWSSELTAYPQEVAEMALAHTIKNKVEAAYRRGDLFDKRRNLMEDWARFVETPPADGDVIPIRRRAG
jgi:integrase